MPENHKKKILLEPTRLGCRFLEVKEMVDMDVDNLMWELEQECEGRDEADCSPAMVSPPAKRPTSEPG